MRNNVYISLYMGNNDYTRVYVGNHDYPNVCKGFLCFCMTVERFEIMRRVWSKMNRKHISGGRKDKGGGKEDKSGGKQDEEREFVCGRYAAQIW